MIRYADICISEEIMEKYKSLECFNEETKLSVSQGQPGSSNCLYLTQPCVYVESKQYLMIKQINHYNYFESVLFIL